MVPLLSSRDIVSTDAPLSSTVSRLPTAAQRIALIPLLTLTFVLLKGLLSEGSVPPLHILNPLNETATSA